MRQEISRTSRRSRPRIPPWLHRILGIRLELKLLGANIIIMSVALLLMFGPVRLEPPGLTDAFVAVAALGAGAIVNLVLVRLALRPVNSIARVGWLVSEGVLGARVPQSVMADPSLARLSSTINNLLDDLVAERAGGSGGHPGFSPAGHRGGEFAGGFSAIRSQGARR